MTEQGLPFWKRRRRVAFWGLVFVGLALAGGWLVPSLVFHYRFGAFLPAGVSSTTNVISVSWPPPPDVPPTFSRQVRESIGGYYGNLRKRGNTLWKQFPKALDDVLDEYGARVQDGKLVDMNGRNICIVTKLPGWRADRRDWDGRREKLLQEHCTVPVVGVEDDE